MLKIGMIAGEASGDLLGAGLIDALRARHTDIRVFGVAGPRMQAAGCETWISASELAVMGIFEVLGHLPRLLRLRRELVRRFQDQQPDVFIGIDSPDFNLGVEYRLRASGIRTMHYVSPTVWAWRERRVRTVAQAADEVLCLFPFEETFYENHGVVARFVGHPMADTIPMHSDRHAARVALDLGPGLSHADASTVDEQSDPGPRLVAVLPGSRRGEVARMGPVFADAISKILEARPHWQFVAPMAGSALHEMFRAQLEDAGVAGVVKLVDGQAQVAMAAADAVLLASGTAALEALLIKRPMVVGYRLAPLTYRLIRLLGLMRVERFSLPNLLAGDALVPEMIQNDMTATALANSVIEQVENEAACMALEGKFTQIHELLRQNASEQAAQAVLSLAEGSDLYEQSE